MYNSSVLRFVVVSVTKTGLTHYLMLSYRAMRLAKKGKYKFYWYRESNNAN